MKPTIFACVFAVAVAVVLSPFPSARAQDKDTCRQGYVWREAFAGDHVCVTPETRAQASQDNGQASARREPGGGAYGPDTCVSGFVWREARPTDHVCVTPETREQTARDNAQAAARRVSSAPAAGSGPVTSRSLGAAAVTKAADGYKLSEWSSWGRVKGVEYRYRWGLNPQDAKYKDRVDVLFQVKNPGARAWQGSVRLLSCSADVVNLSQPLNLRSQETKDVKFTAAPNCGTGDRPAVKPDITPSVRIDP